MQENISTSISISLFIHVSWFSREGHRVIDPPLGRPSLCADHQDQVQEDRRRLKVGQGVL
jgi:hypothetical protein